MTESNGTDRSTPAQPGDTPAEWVPTPEQPWRPIPDDDSGIRYQFDYGMPWCADRAGHPQFQDDGYPSLNHHRTECRSYDGWFGALTDDGTPGYFSAYLVRPFRFGQERGSTVDQTRLAMEFDPAEDGGELFRCTVPASIIRNLAAHLTHTANVGEGWRPPRHVKLSLVE